MLREAIVAALSVFTSILVEFGKFSEHVERIEVERRNHRMSRRIVFDEVHRIQVDGRVVRVRVVRVTGSQVVTRVSGVDPDSVGSGLQVALHLVVVVQVEESGRRIRTGSEIIEAGSESKLT